MRKLKATDADFGNKPESAFSFLAAKIAVCPMIAQGGPSDWLAEKNHPRKLRYFFSPSLAANPGQTDSTSNKK
ncbi:hypothetical protein [Bacteroides reticulotermitis]|uniref:Uncharacterized protein n=1 Tax=Bacteroides reticulotermitis JCM 10512 TaxID=1445607 RepID=W4UWJ0_9BACE|nr:hypothetical protein [Bacteroides reticulotermitis]GAE84884.1 hypothetical protein JCM10512_3260 [Bacteroides reticulotermitis JCM 10512]